MRRYDEALDCCKKVLEIDPQHVLAMNNMGNVLQYQNNINAALEWFNKSIAIDAQQPFTWYNKGKLFVMHWATKKKFLEKLSGGSNPIKVLILPTKTILFIFLYP